MSPKKRRKPKAPSQRGKAKRANVGAGKSSVNPFLTDQPRPDHYVNVGNKLLDKGRPDKALVAYNKALQFGRGSIEIYYNMGNAFLDLGRFDAAAKHYKKVVELNPGLPEPYNNMGIALQAHGHPSQAIASYRKAIEIKPDFPEAWNNMGISLDDTGELDEAISCFQQALQLRRRFPEALSNMANAYIGQGKYEEAPSLYDEALRLVPDPGLEVKKTFVLPVINPSNQVIEMTRQKLIEELRILKNKGLSLEDPHVQVRCVTNSLVYHGLNDRQLQEEIASFYRTACPSLEWVAPNIGKRRGKHDKIRIGFISRFLYNHTIGRLNLGIIRELSREKFHVTVLQFPGKEDHMAKAIGSAADEVVALTPSLDVARREIAKHQLDILFYLDIGMEPFTYYLAFSRLARVQCVTWGHPVTTGIPNMDYFISSEKAEPPGAEEHYSESLIRLRKPGVYYYRPELPDGLSSRDRFNLPSGHNLYVCPQTLFKFHPDFDDILARILHEDRHGLLVLIEGDHPNWTKILLERFARAFPSEVDRVRFLPQMPTLDFLSLLKLADVLLDTINFCGGNTSLESFALGTPIVTLPGKFLRGRLTMAIYQQMGVMDCVAEDAESYVEIALRLGKDRNWREEIRSKIKARAHVLYEDIEAVRELERFFEWATGHRENGTGDCVEFHSA